MKRKVMQIKLEVEHGIGERKKGYKGNEENEKSKFIFVTGGGGT
jgi:hypothetical protein